MHRLHGSENGLALWVEVTSQSVHVQASDGTGSFSVTKTTDTSGKGLSGGTSNKGLSAAQLANAQQVIKQANELAARTNYTGPVVLGSGDGYTQASAIPLHAMMSRPNQGTAEGQPERLGVSSKGLRQCVRQPCRCATTVQLCSHGVSSSKAASQQSQHA